MSLDMLPAVTFGPITRAQLNTRLAAWGHAMGPCERPTKGWSHGLAHQGELVAVAATDHLVTPQVAGLTRAEALELSRMCAVRRDLCRVALRLWREFVFRPLGEAYGYAWALSYQDEGLHTGGLYRFDGWLPLARTRSGTDNRSGRRGRNKTTWGWSPDAALMAAARDALAGGGGFGVTVEIFTGDCREVLASLPAGIAHTCITSPPYFGLRDYGTATWEGGDPACDHQGRPMQTAANINANWNGGADVKNAERREFYRDLCGKCGARREDHQIGLETTPDEFVDSMVAVFRQVRRVLRDDGTLWLNLGDTYASAPGQSTRGGPPSETSTLEGNGHRGGGAKLAKLMRVGTGANKGHIASDLDNRPYAPGLKPKDLIGIPWRVAFALQADGWFLRQDIIWAKPNPMPESVTDRCTKAHEHLFLLAKSERYHFDAAAIAEESIYQPGSKPEGRKGTFAGKRAAGASGLVEESFRAIRETRNKRDVWTVPTAPYAEAHFATYPPALIEPCVLAGAPAGGIVLDPFGGAGTTGLVADRLGRNAILVELNPDFADMARRRIQAEDPLLSRVRVRG
jgi:DNA modification methylase